MHEEGKNVVEIMKETGLSRASVHSYLPYQKSIYKLLELSTGAERIKKIRERKESVAVLQRCISELLNDAGGKEFSDLPIMYECNDKLWQTICIFEGYPFYTSKGLKFYYKVKGNEIFVDRKEKSKSITRSSVELAFYNALKLIQDNQSDFGPKKLKVFGASYIWGIFRRVVGGSDACTTMV